MKPIRVYCCEAENPEASTDKRLVGRDSFVVAFYAQGDYAAVAQSVPGVFERWLQLVPEKALVLANMGMRGSAELKPFTKNTLTKIREELDPETAVSKNGGKVHIKGGDGTTHVSSFGHDDCPEYALDILGRDGVFVDDENTHIIMYFPAEFPEQHGHDETVAAINALVGSFPYTSGYASLALTLDASGGRADGVEYARVGGEQLYPLLKRHPGYDVADRFCRLGSKCRGARWLTYLGKKLVRQLPGGQKGLKARLGKEIEVQKVGHGTLIRAGSRPELADLDKGQEPELLKTVAKAIEPVTLFDNSPVLNGFVDLEHVREESEKWSRRFFD